MWLVSPVNGAIRTLQRRSDTDYSGRVYRTEMPTIFCPQGHPVELASEERPAFGQTHAALQPGMDSAGEIILECASCKGFFRRAPDGTVTPYTPRFPPKP